MMKWSGYLSFGSCSSQCQLLRKHCRGLSLCLDRGTETCAECETQGVSIVAACCDEQCLPCSPPCALVQLIVVAPARMVM